MGNSLGKKCFQKLSKGMAVLCSLLFYICTTLGMFLLVEIEEEELFKGTVALDLGTLFFLN